MATTGVNAIFIDTNVLVYANVAGAPLHSIALNVIQQHRAAGTELWISRQVLREYMATVTRPQAFMQPQSPAIVIARVQYFQNRFYMAEDGPQATANLLALIQQVPVGGKQTHDANLVATMQANGIRHLLTHNMADFARYASFITVVPL